MNLAVIICNRNDPQRTDALCERLLSLSKKHPVDLFVVESGSDLDKLSKYASVWYRENTNWVQGFNLGMEYARRHKTRHTGVPYDAYWLLCNDAQFPDSVLPEDRDPVAAIHRAIEAARAQGNNWAVIHPYQSYFTPGHPGFPLNKKGKSLRQVSFVEFVCPVFNAYFLGACEDRLGHTPLYEPFTRGWGVDYMLSYYAGMLGWKIYNCDDVGTLHIPNTSHLNHLQTKTEDNPTFLNAARTEMLNVLVKEWGKDWGDQFLKVIPELPDQCFKNWSQGDRQASKNWRVT